MNIIIVLWTNLFYLTVIYISAMFLLSILNEFLSIGEGFTFAGQIISKNTPHTEWESQPSINICLSMYQLFLAKIVPLQTLTIFRTYLYHNHVFFFIKSVGSLEKVYACSICFKHQMGQKACTTIAHGCGGPFFYITSFNLV